MNIELIVLDDSDEDVVIVEDSDDDVVILEDTEGRDIEKNNSDIELQSPSESNNSDTELPTPSESECTDECSKSFNHTYVRVLRQADINDLNETTKMCNIFFFYKTYENEHFCSSCFLRVADLYSTARAVRLHKSLRYVQMTWKSCCNCGCSLNQVFSCRVCPVCTQ